MVRDVAEVELTASPEYAACRVVGGSIAAKFPGKINRWSAGKGGSASLSRCRRENGRDVRSRARGKGDVVVDGEKGCYPTSVGKY